MEHSENIGGGNTVPDVVETVVQEVNEDFDVQPVLFVGAGLSRRYIGAPDWDGALAAALSVIGEKAPPYSYFVQKYDDDKVRIGTAIGELLFEWAWSEGKGRFPEELFKSSDKFIFIKELVAEQLRSATPETPLEFDPNFAAELEALRAIRPHAVITTNFDEALETVFDGYEPIVGRGVLRYDLNSFGEIFHIHGSARQPSSMILTEADYGSWSRQSRYFAAKLLTYFVEHPVFIFGYSVSDPNVKTVLRDIGRIASDDEGLIPNVVQVVWHAALKTGPYQSEMVIEDDEENTSYRLRVLNVTDLKAVYTALTARHELKQINPALLRALAARLMKLTRKDIPAGTVEVDYATLERVAKDDSALPTMLGLTFADNDNKTHPFIMTQVAEQLGLKHHNYTRPILQKFKDETGHDLRSSDNRYHERIKTGKKAASATRKWSHEAVDLFRDVLAGRAYEVNL